MGAGPLGPYSAGSSGFLSTRVCWLLWIGITCRLSYSCSSKDAPGTG